MAQPMKDQFGPEVPAWIGQRLSLVAADLQVATYMEFGLLEFYTEEVAVLKDVQSVETFVVYKSYNLKIPYIF